MNQHWKRKTAAGISRRHFLKRTAAAIALPTIVPSSIFGADRPSNKITVGIIGWGMQGPQNTENFLNEKDCQVVAACDVDKNHLQGAVNTINGHYENKDCAAFHDCRELLARKDIDAVMIAVPDPRTHRPHRHADWPQNPVGCCEGRNRRRCGCEQAAHTRIPRAMEADNMKNKTRTIAQPSSVFFLSAAFGRQLVYNWINNAPGDLGHGRQCKMIVQHTVHALIKI
jgi:Oxidoreductase family, NAD-binding Rossmann fold